MKNILFNSVAIVAVILCSFEVAFAMGDSTSTRTAKPVVPDSVVKADTAQTQKTGMTKSPTGAVLRSIACPGWGQLYNESYIKSALFFGGAATCVTIIVWNQQQFANATTLYENTPDTDPNKNLNYRRKEFYRDQRDVAGLWLLGVYALSAIDAYVGAHLYDFDVSDKNVTVLPVSDGRNFVSLQCSIRW
ncbi:MAG: DUF5683 domain-containing protein [Candidatus Kapaibacterium sp.]|nr:hypothetical protein [Bacteroidota bacterium]